MIYLIWNCVVFNISFYFNDILLIKFLYFWCEILNCFFEVIVFKCMLSGKNVGVYFNEILSKKEENILKDINSENELCNGKKI